MKIRMIIAAILGLSVFVGLIVAAGLTGVYCDQIFPNDSIPIVCAEARSNYYPIAKVAINITGWLIVIGLPLFVAALYLRFGWPKGWGASTEPTQQPDSKKEDK